MDTDPDSQYIFNLGVWWHDIIQYPLLNLSHIPSPYSNLSAEVLGNLWKPLEKDTESEGLPFCLPGFARLQWEGWVDRLRKSFGIVALGGRWDGKFAGQTAL